MDILKIIEVVLIVIGILYIFAISAQVNQLKKDVKKLKKKDRGAANMSKIISELIGKKCKITYSDGISSEMCEILDTDDEWVKMKIESKKDKDTVKVIRIDVIDEVTVLGNN